MVRFRWKYIGSTKYSKVFVDYNRSRTKIEGEKYIYYHDGIYPYHNPECNVKVRK